MISTAFAMLSCLCQRSSYDLVVIYFPVIGVRVIPAEATHTEGVTVVDFTVELFDVETNESVAGFEANLDVEVFVSYLESGTV